MTEHVLKIHLFDGTYQSYQEAIDVNRNIDLPQYICDDRRAIPVYPSYELKGRSINHLQQVEAHYAECIAPVVSTYLSLLISSVQRFYIPKIYTAPTTQQMIFSQPFDPLGIPVLQWIEEEPVLASTEPECRCDIRALTSSGHEPGCAYINWKRGRK